MKKYFLLTLILFTICCIGIAFANTQPVTTSAQQSLNGKAVQGSKIERAQIEAEQAKLEAPIVPSTVVRRDNSDKPPMNIVPSPPDPNVILQGGDNVGNATVIPLLPYSDVGTTTGYINDYDATMSPCFATSTSPDVVYSFTPVTDVTADISLCGNSAYDTKLFIFQNTAGNVVACHDDDCSSPLYSYYVSMIPGFSFVAGNTYYIVIDGYGGGSGAYTIDITPLGAPPANDICTNVTPQLLNVGSTLTFTGDNTNATANDCAMFGSYPDVWEAFYTTEPAVITLDYCTTAGPFGNAWLNLTFDCACAAITAAAAYDFTTCGDGNVTMTWGTLAAGTYYYPVLKDVGNGAVGPYTIHVTATAAVPCVPDIQITAPGTWPGTTCGMGNEWTNTCLGSYDGGEDYVYEVIVPTDMMVTVALDPLGTTWTGVALATDCEMTNCLGYSTNSGGTPHSLAPLALTAGTYFVMVDTWPTPDCIPSYNLSIQVPVCVPDQQITAPGTWAGTTCGMGYDNQSSCLGSYDGGEDYVYEVILPIDTTIEITLDPLGTSYTGVAIATDCFMTNCLGFNTNYDITPHSIPALTLPAGTYYIMVDTWPSPDCIPSYNLTVAYGVPCVVEDPPGSIAEVEPNDACNMLPDPPEWNYIACGQTVNGTGWFDGSTRDTDWFLFNVTENSYVTLTATAEFDWLAGLIIPLSADPCDNTGYFDYSITGGPCDTLSVTGEMYFPGPGSYIAWFGPQFTNVFTEGDYWMTMTCEHLPSPGFSVNPTAVNGQADTGGVDTELLTVSNPGDLDLTADISVSIDPPPPLASLPHAGNDPMASLRLNDVEKVPGNVIAPAPDPNVILQGGDNIGTATPITSLPYNDAGTTVGYTNDYEEVCPYSSTSPDVVYSFVATVDSVIAITLCNGSLYDTKLFVYENAVGNLVGCNDDACPGFYSELSALYNAPVTVTAGNTYYIVVDGYGGGSGSYVIDVDYAEPPPPPPGCPDTGVLLGANPTLPAEAWNFLTSDTELNYTVFENFAGVFGIIEEVHFWGLDLTYSAGWTECVEDPAAFEIAFYTDAGGLPGTQVGLYNVSISPVPVALFGGSYQQNAYVAAITPPMVLSSGWFSIKNTSIDGCSFLWQNTLFITDGNSLQYDGITYSQTFEDLSFCFIGTYQEPWLSTDVSSISVPPGGTAPVNVGMNAAGLTEGTYTGSVIFNTNELGATIHTIPVTFDVGGAGACVYVAGDINNNGSPNGIDVTFGVSYLKGGGAPADTCFNCPDQGDTLLAAMDVNGNCQANGIDITFFVAYLKQLQPALKWCLDCPPARMAMPGQGQDRPAIVPFKKAVINQQ